MDTLQEQTLLDLEQDSFISNSELKESKVIEFTPFTAHKYGEKWIVTVWKYKVGPIFENEEEMYAYISNPNWDMIATTIQAIVEANLAKTLKQ